MRLLATAILATLPFAAHAQQPTIFPTRDVAITYRATGPQGPMNITMAFSTASGLMRIDVPGGGPMGGGWMLFDHRAGSARMVMDQQRMVMTMDGTMVPGGGGFRPSPDARFTREGADRVAGLACTNWRIEDRGNRARACLTDDGVMLRAQPETQGAGTLEATEISYGPQDPARFTVPTGYQTMDMQQMMQGLQQRQGQRPPPR
ncbi:DUF4412 domain-containing protein [Plastoroseomonas arctica]|uniref:DUF4412 domain-containing protein n=1 Tax=Plastoroseomonas arctica TaxID=1509237 RepID=A0AAF1K6B7_9PROT|nr:DUF4412 domain-containing protein [Plastoroseomonas arctica]MBR0657159.1 DUF4412 domain-containing protein [Plastoroseomonas arctica]